MTTAKRYLLTRLPKMPLIPQPGSNTRACPQLSVMKTGGGGEDGWKMLKMAPSFPPGPTPLQNYRRPYSFWFNQIDITIFIQKLEPWVNFSKTENSGSINPLDCCVQDAAVESLVVTHIIYDFSFASSDTFFLSDIKPCQYQRKKPKQARKRR